MGDEQLLSTISKGRGVPAKVGGTQGGRTSPGIAQYQHLNNCIPDIPFAYPYVS